MNTSQKNLKQTNTCTLSPTSAMVLLWLGKDFYSNLKTKQYFNSLDLSEGEFLVKKLEGVIDYYDEIMKNRKFSVKKIAFDFLEKNKDAQVVILAAGVDPLSVEIASQFSKAKIFDVDLDNMQIKKNLIKNLQDLDNIYFVEADLSNIEHFKEKLKASTWNPNKTTLLIAEGITYYISKKSLWSIVSYFNSKDNKNAFIMEYMIPSDLVDEKNRHIPEEIFKRLSSTLDLTSVVKYTEEIIEEEIKKINGNLQFTYSMTDMEKIRTNQTKFFTKKEDCWVQISYSSI